MMKTKKFDFKKNILPLITSVVVFALMVLLIIVTRKPEDAEASATIGGVTYSPTGKHMGILEIVPDDVYDVLGVLVSDSQGCVQWKNGKDGIVDLQPDSSKTSEFEKYLSSQAHNYLYAINLTLGTNKKITAYFYNTLTNELYDSLNANCEVKAKALNYDLNNLQLRFYEKDGDGKYSKLLTIDDKVTGTPIRDVFSYSVFNSGKMEGSVDVRYVKAKDVKKSDIDNAAMVYFSRFYNDGVGNIYKANNPSKSFTENVKWKKGDLDLQSDIALYLYMEMISSGKAVVYSSTEKPAQEVKSSDYSNINKIMVLTDGIDGDYFVRDFAFDYKYGKNSYSGNKGTVKLEDNTINLYVNGSKMDFALNMFTNSSAGYCESGRNNTSYYPIYNAGIGNTALRRASLEQNSENALVQKFNDKIETQDDYKEITTSYWPEKVTEEKYNGTYFDDARKALGLDENSDIDYSQAIRYILGDFDTSNISTIKVLEVEPAGYYRYNASSIDDQKNIRKWFSLSTETNSDGKFTVPYNIVIDHCSTNALIGKNVDLAAEYDLIIIGAYGKDKFDTSDSVTPFNKEILGNVFSKGSSLSSLVSEKDSDVTDAALNGNDITDKVYDKLYDYSLRGMPVVFDKCLYFGDTDVTDDDTNMYKLRMDDLITKILKDKGTNGNLTYTDVSEPGEQKISIRLKFIKKPGEVIGSTYTNYNGKLSNSVVYSLDGLDGTTQVDDVDGNIKVTFRGSEALPSGNYRIKIYIDRNEDGIFADDIQSDKKELLYYDETNARGSNDEYYGKLYSSNGTDIFETSILLPAASRGYFAWKVEIVKITGTDFSSVNKVKYSAKSVKEGGFAIKGNETTVRVLQINGDDGSLKIESGSKFATHFNKASKVTGLNLSVTRKNFEEINAITDIEKEFGKYSMIVLGMKDSYGKDAKFNDNVIAALQKYINDGNAVLFTHDTMSYYNSENKTIKSYNELTKFTKGFLPLIGMKYSGSDSDINTNFTDSLHYWLARKGLKNFPYVHQSEGVYEEIGSKTTTTNKISKLNDGQITEFPYSIDNDVGVATTHSQYFALDLDNHYADNKASSTPTIYNADGSMASQPVVWYTLNSGKVDTKGYYDYNGQEAMSNYYIYSYGNVTYSTAGHSDITGESEIQLFVNTFTRALLSGNNNPEVMYTDDGSKYDENTTDYKNYVKTEFDKLARTKLSFKFRIIDADLISNSDTISDAFMYIYNDDGTRTDAMYDSSKDKYLGKINEATLSDGTKTISLTGSTSSVIVGKEYTVDNFWDVLTELNSISSTKINIASLMSQMKNGNLKIGILATDGRDGKGYAILTIDCKTLFDLD